MFEYDPCSCGPDTCLKAVEPPSACINRLKGVVEAVRCEKCGGDTWHHNGECIRCQRVAALPKEVIPMPGLQSHRKVASSETGITLSITLGNTPLLCSDKSKVAKILKILLEE